MLISFIYITLTMMIGSRGQQIILYMLFLYVYQLVYKFNIKMRLSNKILYGLIIYFLLTAVVTISKTRAIVNLDIMTFMDSFVENFINTPFADLFGELGGTMLSLCYSIRYLSTNVLNNLIKLPINMLIGLIPFATKFFSNVENGIYFTSAFPSGMNSALGGSFVGECFAWFGNFGFIFSFFIGLFIIYISDKIEMKIRCKEYYNFCYYIIIYHSLLFYSRDYLFNVVSNFLFVGLILFILKRIFHYQE